MSVEDLKKKWLDAMKLARSSTNPWTYVFSSSEKPYSFHEQDMLFRAAEPKIQELLRAESAAKRAYDIAVEGEAYFARLKAESDAFAARSAAINEGGERFYKEFLADFEACVMSNHQDCGLDYFKCRKKHHRVYEKKESALRAELSPYR